jgi:hypothetical protein
MAAPSITPSASTHATYRGPAASAPVVQASYQRCACPRAGWQHAAERLVTVAARMHFADVGRTTATVGSRAGLFGSMLIAAVGRTLIK